jgi:hypothetical protein
MSDEGHDVEAREGCTPLQASAFRKVIYTNSMLMTDHPFKTTVLFFRCLRHQSID